MLSKLGNKLGNEVNYLNKKGLSLQKERGANLPLVEAEEEPSLIQPHQHIDLFYKPFKML